MKLKGVYRQYGATNLSELNINVSKDWDGYQITNVADPVAAQDVTTKTYVDKNTTTKAIIFGVL